MNKIFHVMKHTNTVGQRRRRGCSLANCLNCAAYDLVSQLTVVPTLSLHCVHRCFLASCRCNVVPLTLQQEGAAFKLLQFCRNAQTELSLFAPWSLSSACVAAF